jgi:outer membrane lipoprotein-sorting protein
MLCVLILIGSGSKAQEADSLVKKVRAKLAAVHDYQAEGIMKTDVPFMKLPESKVTIFFKNPDKFKVRKQDGIAIVPRGGINVNLGTLFAGNSYTAVPAGKADLNGKAVTVVKLLPLDEKSDVVVSTLYIDPKEYLVRKAIITTRENGTYEMDMSYGVWANKGLPDKVTLVFALKDYKLPKGLALDYDTGDKPKTANTTANQKGKVEISYSNYIVNKGISDAIFQ